MKNIYLAITVQNSNGGKCAYTKRISTCENLLAVMQRIPKTAIDVTICETRKQANETVNAWNEQYKAQGILEWL